MIKFFLIVVMVLFLTACTKTQIVYKELPREPITCVDTIKTPLDMAKCLAEYKEKY